MEGWISLYRKIQDHWIWKSPETFDKRSAWLSLLFKANHKDTKVIADGKIIQIKKGSFVTSELKLADEWGWSRKKVRTFLQRLEMDKMLAKKSTTRDTIITIENWELYQNQEQQKNSKRTAEEQPRNTDNNENNVINNNNNNNNIGENQEQKVHFADFVTMTNAEYEKLISTYGKNFADQCITVLDNYKGSNGKSYKSDYRAILTWVIDKVKEKNSQAKAKTNQLNKQTNYNNYNQREYKDLNNLYANGGKNEDNMV